jgi:hypothetical protein
MSLLRLFPAYRRLERELETARQRKPQPAPTPAVPGPPRYLVAKSSTVGIGNRLLFLAGAAVVGRLTGRQVIVDWRDGMFGAPEENAFWSFFQESDAFNIREFRFLEEAPPEDFTAPEWSGHLPLDITARYRLQAGLGADTPVKGSQLEATGWKYAGFFSNYADPRRVLVTYGGKSRLADFPKGALAQVYPGLDRDALLAQLLRTQFRPAPELIRRRDAFIQSHFGNRPVLGIHLRNTDKTPTRPPEELRARAAELAAPLGPEARVFLATDHQPTQDLFRQTFGERLILLPKWFDPAETPVPLHYSTAASAAQKRQVGLEALLDLYLLAACPHLYLQANSTFSRIVAYLTPAPAAHLHWHSDEDPIPWDP